MITAYIDGDWIMYAAGFAGQKNKYVCPAEFGEREFTTKTELREAFGETSPMKDDDLVYSRIVLDPESHFFHSAKNMIQRNVDKIESKFGEEVEPVVLLDGDGNFRSRLATIKPYKGNRVSGKPLMYGPIRQYLLDVWDAEVVHGQETDDEMAIRQTVRTNGGFKSIIVAVDKDMLQVPGWHLIPNKGFKQISEKRGTYRLYHQCITGDATDNIGGAYKYGPAAATKAVSACTSEAELWDSTVSAYHLSIEKHGDGIYGGLNAIQAATENMRLVYLRREPEETWTPPEA